MADKNKKGQIEEKLRQILEKLEEALDELVGRRHVRPQPVPIPVDRPYRKR